MTITVIFFIVVNVVEAMLLLFALASLKDFNEDFNIRKEVMLYSASWMFYCNLIAFLYT